MTFKTNCAADKLTIVIASLKGVAIQSLDCFVRFHPPRNDAFGKFFINSSCAKFLQNFFLLVFLIFGACSGSVKSPHDTAGVDELHLWEYKKNHFNMYSISDEIKIGESVQKQQIEAFKRKNLSVDPSEHDAVKKRIESIVARIARVSDLPSLPYEVHIYDKPDVVNAFCMPGGKIGVFSGLWNKDKGLVNLASDDEIAAVLSHEMAHANLRHVTRQLTTYNGLNVVGGLLSLGIGSAAGGNWQQVFNQVFSTGTSLYLPSYTRRHETEADQVGFYYATKAGFDPQAAIRIWERAAEEARKKGKSDHTHFLATHPGSADRAEFLKGFLDDIDDIKKHAELVAESKKDK